jgi:branched-chain amino acid transport system permease protein
VIRLPFGHRLVTRPVDELRLYRSGWSKLGLLLLAAGYCLAPLALSDFWLLVLDYTGVAAIGAIGLNLLTGYAGQVPLGQAFFLGAGAYVAVGLGVDQAMPLLVWLPAALAVGSLLGAAIGPAALRLRGDYLAIVTIGVVFLGEYVFSNWHSLTGGSSGTASDAPVAVGPLDFADLRLAGESYSRQQGYYWLIWAIVAVIALLVKNISRTRPGRALQAVRDRDLAAEVIGVPLARYKVSAFALSSGLAAVAGALFASLQDLHLAPPSWVVYRRSEKWPSSSRPFVGSLPGPTRTASEAAPGACRATAAPERDPRTLRSHADTTRAVGLCPALRCPRPRDVLHARYRCRCDHPGLGGARARGREAVPGVPRDRRPALSPAGQRRVRRPSLRLGRALPDEEPEADGHRERTYQRHRDASAVELRPRLLRPQRGLGRG